jgi:phosphogluconate dehydratase
VRDGDLVRLDAVNGTLDVLIDDASWSAREPVRLGPAQAQDNAHGLGRELFGGMRKNVTSAEEGACTWL